MVELRDYFFNTDCSERGIVAGIDRLCNDLHIRVDGVYEKMTQYSRQFEQCSKNIIALCIELDYATLFSQIAKQSLNCLMSKKDESNTICQFKHSLA